MPRYIDAEKLEKHFEYCIAKAFNTNGVTEDFEIALKATKNQPTADVSTVRHGHWIEQCEESLYSCSACGTEWITIVGTPKENDMDFCPHCGAKMDEEENENDREGSFN